jgi:hypothetical protein
MWKMKENMRKFSKILNGLIGLFFLFSSGNAIARDAEMSSSGQKILKPDILHSEMLSALKGNPESGLRVADHYSVKYMEVYSGKISIEDFPLRDKNKLNDPEIVKARQIYLFWRQIAAENGNRHSMTSFANDLMADQNPYLCRRAFFWIDRVRQNCMSNKECDAAYISYLAGLKKYATNCANAKSSQLRR